MAAIANIFDFREKLFDLQMGAAVEAGTVGISHRITPLNAAQVGALGLGAPTPAGQHITRNVGENGGHYFTMAFRRNSYPGVAFCLMLLCSVGLGLSAAWALKRGARTFVPIVTVGSLLAVGATLWMAWAPSTLKKTQWVQWHATTQVVPIPVDLEPPRG